MRHAAQVAHHSPGRLRLKVPTAKGNRAALESIRKSLAALNAVKQVQVNETTGSVTVHYDANARSSFEQHLANGGPHQEVVEFASPPKLEDLAEVDSMLEHEAEFLAQHSEFARTLAGWLKGLDDGIKRISDNNLDFKVVAPLVLAAGAFMELGVTAATPVWLTLSLFSFNHFVDIHSLHDAPHPADPAQTPPVRKKARPSS